MIIGVTGKYAVGKDLVAEILEKVGYEHISLSDMIREDIRKVNPNFERDDLIIHGNYLRSTHGPAILAKMALKKVEEGKNYTITSIRSPFEVELLQEREDFYLINVTCPDDVRLERIKKRNRENDPKTLEELRAKEALENTSNPNAQQLNKVASMAEYFIGNESTEEVTAERLFNLIKNF